MKKNAAIFGDPDENIGDLLEHWGLSYTSFISESSLLASTDKFDLVVIRAGDGGWRLTSMPAIIKKWSMAIIIVVSGGNYRQMAMSAGADDYHQDGDDTPNDFLNLLKKHKLVK